MGKKEMHVRIPDFERRLHELAIAQRVLRTSPSALRGPMSTWWQHRPVRRGMGLETSPAYGCGPSRHRCIDPWHPLPQLGSQSRASPPAPYARMTAAREYSAHSQSASLSGSVSRGRAPEQAGWKTGMPLALGGAGFGARDRTIPRSGLARRGWLDGA